MACVKFDDRARASIFGYGAALAATLLCTLAGLALRPRVDLVNIAMIYVLAVVIVALRYPQGPPLATAVLGVLAFDVVFVPPQGRLTVDDLQYLMTFAIMLAVALVVSGLVLRVRQRAAREASLALEAETERIRSTLLASVSHDLRTPLAVMVGASSSLAENGERMEAAERRALAQSVCDQAREMADHVAKILQMTRLETGAIVVERDWAAVSEIVAAVLARLAQRLAAHRVIVEVPSDLPLLRVDATLIEQALSNLLENSAQHTPAGTIVRVRAERVAAELIVTVEDYSGGVPQAELERMFAKFHHGTVENGGTDIGLGLAICRSIVRLHGGRAWAESVPGGGTAFRISLPLDAPPAPPPTDDAVT